MRRAWKQIKQNKGETLMVAIVIMLVVMMVTVAILTAAYALFQTVVGQGIQNQCHVLALDVSDILEAQILYSADRVADTSDEGIVRQISAGEFRDRMEKNGSTPGLIQTENPLWYFIRSNMYQSSWPSWDSSNEDLNHLDTIAWKKYNADILTAEEKQALPGYEIEVVMYWLDDDGGVSIDPTLDRPHEDFSSRLVLRVVCSCDRYESVITTEYLLNVGRFADPQPVVEATDLTMMTDSGNNIYWQENWQFDRYTRR